MATATQPATSQASFDSHKVPPNNSRVSDLIMRQTVSIPPETNLSEALKVMVVNNIHRLPVLDSNSKCYKVYFDSKHAHILF
jgi:CBS domain-containing protein